MLTRAQLHTHAAANHTGQLDRLHELARAPAAVTGMALVVVPWAGAERWYISLPVWPIFTIFIFSLDHLHFRYDTRRARLL